MRGIHLESSSIVNVNANHLSFMGNASWQEKIHICYEIINITDKGRYIHIR